MYRLMFREHWDSGTMKGNEVSSTDYFCYYICLFIYLFSVCKCMLECSWAPRCTFGGQRTIWMSRFLGMELRSSGLAARAFTHWAISLAQGKFVHPYFIDGETQERLAQLPQNPVTQWWREVNPFPSEAKLNTSAATDAVLGNTSSSPPE